MRVSSPCVCVLENETKLCVCVCVEVVTSWGYMHYVSRGAVHSNFDHCKPRTRKWGEKAPNIRVMGTDGRKEQGSALEPLSP